MLASSCINLLPCFRNALHLCHTKKKPTLQNTKWFLFCSLWKNKPRNIIIFQLSFVLLKNQLKLFQVYEVFRFFALSKMLYLAHLSHFNIPLLRIPTFLDKKQNNASSTVLENGISLENCQNREICFMNTIFSFWGFLKIFCGLPIFYDFLIVGSTKNDNFGSLCHVGLW